MVHFLPNSTPEAPARSLKAHRSVLCASLQFLRSCGKREKGQLEEWSKA